MTIEHVSIADPDIHEPKGVASAASGAAYIANGVGSGSWQGITPSNRVIVNTLSDFPTPSGGVITLSDNTEYYIGGNNVDIGTNRFLWGTNTTMNGAVGASKVTSSTTGNLFTAADAGLMVLSNVIFDAGSATLFSVIDSVQGTTTVISDTCQYSECVSVGTFNNVLGVNFANNSFLDTDQGFSLASSITVITIRQNLMISTSATFNAVDFGTAVSSTIEIVDLAVNAPAGANGLAGAANNANVSPGSIALVSSCEFLGGMDALDGNITLNDIRWDFLGNSGIQDTMQDGLSSLNSNAIATILAVGVPTLVAGTWVVESVSHFTGTTAGRLTYVGERDLTVPVSALLTIDPASGTNKSIRAFIAKNGTEITNSGHSVNISSGDPKQLVITWQITFSENDFIEAFIENETDSVNATVIDGTLRAN